MTAADDPGELMPALSEPLLADLALSAVLDAVVHAATQTIPAAHEASVSLQRGRLLETITATSAAIREVDQRQYENDSGPCVEVIRTGDEVTSNLADGRWPEFEQSAQDHGFRSVWSLPLRLGDHHPGALNLYSHDPDLADRSGDEPARTIASQAAVVVANGDALDRLRSAKANLEIGLNTRTIIGQAQGVLIATEHISADRAFDILRRASQRQNRKLRDIAAEIVTAAQERKQ